MKTGSKIAIFFAGVALAATQAIAASPPDAKLWEGTWHLDSAKSKWTVGKEQSETRSYTIAGGKITMKSTSKDADGKEMTFTYSAAWDGKTYPMTGNPNADSISITPISGQELKASSHLHGKPTVETIATVSPDGKHLTLKRTYVARQGNPTEVLEFNR